MKAKNNLKQELSDWVEMPNESTKKEVREMEAFYGYDETIPLSLGNDYIELFYELCEDKKILNAWNFMNRRADLQYVKGSISFWDELGIKLREVDMIDAKYANKSDGEFVMDEEFLNAIRTVHPSQIPVFLNIKRAFVGVVHQFDIYGAEALETNSVLFTNIELPKFNNQLTSCYYNHEITHTQTSFIKGIISNYLNTETLPIFIEQVLASKIDSSGSTLSRVRDARLFDLVNNIFNCMGVNGVSYENKIEYDKYIQSTLQAIALANIYLNGTLGVQHEMTSDINSMFQGNGTVEHFLDKYEANLPQVSKEAKMLKKTL